VLSLRKKVEITLWQPPCFLLGHVSCTICKSPSGHCLTHFSKPSSDIVGLCFALDASFD
jgi:hypothetical protein